MLITEKTVVRAKELDTPEKHEMAIQAFVNAGFTKVSKYGNYDTTGYECLGISSCDTDIVWIAERDDSIVVSLEQLINAENAVVKEVSSAWYDYDKCMALTCPPPNIKCEVLHRSVWREAFIIGKSTAGTCVYENPSDNPCFLYDGHTYDKFRPLDWDKVRKEKQRKELVDMLCSFSRVTELADHLIATGYKQQ